MIGENGTILLFKTSYVHSKEKMEDVFSISRLSQYVTSDAYGETPSCHFLGLLSQT